MATIKEEWARLQFLMEKGRGEETVHVVFVEQEAKERIENKKEKTRISFDPGDKDTYKHFHEQRERYIGICGGNTVIAADLMILVLKLHPDRELRNFADAWESVKSGAAGGKS